MDVCVDPNGVPFGNDLGHDLWISTSSSGQQKESGMCRRISQRVQHRGGSIGIGPIVERERDPGWIFGEAPKDLRRFAFGKIAKGLTGRTGDLDGDHDGLPG
jgi:hypothetical protein